MLILPLLALAACAPPKVLPASYYATDPEKRTVTIDEHTIYVLPQMGGYVAWGSGSDKWAKYRQSRAIEIYSKCRVDTVYSTAKDTAFFASVKC